MPKLAAPILLEEQAVTPNIETGSLILYAKDDGHLYSRGDNGSETRHPPVEVGDIAPPTPKIGDLWLATGVGPASPNGNFSVGSVNPSLSVPGMWIQLGLGPLGEDFTMWIEDGV